MVKRSFYLLYIFLLLPILTKASAYWLEVKGTGKPSEEVTVELIYGNIDDLGIRHRQDGKELALAADFKFTVITPAGEKLTVKLFPKKDCWYFLFKPQLKGTYRIMGINDRHPVVDRSKLGGENILPVDYLCSQYQIGKEISNLSHEQFLDINTSIARDTIHINAYSNNIPSKQGTKLRVFNPQNWEKELNVDEFGKAAFLATTPGMYIIRQDLSVKKNGQLNGVPYTSIRYRCNYCLFYNLTTL